MSFKESCKWIDSRQEDLLNNLMRLSEINSGTSNLEGIRTVADYFRSYFSGTADSFDILIYYSFLFFFAIEKTISLWSFYFS